MKSLVEAFSRHLEEALEIGNRIQFNIPDRPLTRIVISGLGGSGIGGRIVSQLIAEYCPVPVICSNDYVLPAFVDPQTLVVISSYSGDTEETVAAFHEAREKGAEVACITSGGKIAQLAREQGLNLVLIPSGNPPRAMFGYSAVQQFFVLNAYGFIPSDFQRSISETIQILQREEKNIRTEAASIAAHIVHRIPVLYSEALYEGVAIRWRQQINENAKMLCWHHVFPEMNHNELVGWTGGDNRVAVVLLRNEDDHRRSQVRMEICKKLMGEKCDTIIEVWSKGNDRISRSFYLIHLGDWLSLELADLRHEDATAIPAILYLKGELAKVE